VKKNKSKKWKVLTLLLLMIMAVLTMIVATRKKTSSSEPIMWTSDPTEKYIIGKAVQSPVSPDFSPVVIYEICDGKWYFGASGVCYSNADSGTYRLITSGHVFFKRDRPTSFVLRKLTPCEAAPSWCIERVVTIGKQWGKNLDLAECDIKPISLLLPVISGDTNVNDVTRLTYTKVYTFDDVRPAGLTNVSRHAITSLLSKESVMLCGIIPEADFESWYYLADYKFIAGESGTGFIDGEGALYLAEGAAEFVMDPPTMKVFGLTVRTPGVIFGPFRVRTRK
jgi:hypothetical protein